MEHLYKGRPVQRLMLNEADQETKEIYDINHTRFYAKQKRVALHNCGVIDPENIEEYIGQDGYFALGQVLSQMTPQEVVDVIKKEWSKRTWWRRFFQRGLKMGSLRLMNLVKKNMSFVMPMKEILVLLWIVLFWKEILTV